MYYHEARKAHAEIAKQSKQQREAIKRRRARQQARAARDPHRLLMVEGRACKLLRGPFLMLDGALSSTHATRVLDGLSPLID